MQATSGEPVTRGYKVKGGPFFLLVALPEITPATNHY